MDYNRLILPFLILVMVVTGCGSIREIPVQTVTKEVIRDSIVFVIDTVRIPIEKQVIREVLPAIDTSTLETDLAVSTAFLDTSARMIHHTLEHKPTVLEKEVEIQEKIITKTVTVEKEVPVEVVKEKKIIPVWCWFLLVLNVGVIGLKIGRRFFLKKVGSTS